MNARRVAQALAGALLAATVVATAASPATADKAGHGSGSVVIPTDTGWGFK